MQIVSPYERNCADTHSMALLQQQLPHWYAVRVRTRAEATAATALRHRGFSPYYPVRVERRRYSDRIKTVSEAIIPGYLFCRFELAQRITIISSPGVEYVLSQDGLPAPIPEDEIDSVRRVVEAGASATSYLRTGQRVEVINGALKGVRGILTRDADSERLVVSIDLMNRSVSLQINREDVRVL